MRLMDATLASPALGLVRVVSGGYAHRWAVGTDPLPRDRPSVWSVQLHSLGKFGMWICAGITSSAPPQGSLSFAGSGSYVWTSNNIVYPAGKEWYNPTAPLGHGTSCRSGDILVFHFDPTRRPGVLRSHFVRNGSTARMEVHHAADTPIFIHLNLMCAGNSAEVCEATAAEASLVQ
jgi:hypothetical protein